MTDSNTTGGQVPVNHTDRAFGTSVTRGGQAPVHSTVEGQRGGQWNSRGATSPLGGVMNPTPGDQSKVQEGRERPKGGAY